MLDRGTDDSCSGKIALWSQQTSWQQEWEPETGWKLIRGDSNLDYWGSFREVGGFKICFRRVFNSN